MPERASKSPLAESRRFAPPHLALALAAAIALSACSHGGSHTLPETDPDSSPYDNPSPAERAALGSSTLGRPSFPSRRDGGLEPVSEDAGLAATLSIDRAKRAARDLAADAGSASGADAGAAR